MWKYSRAYGVCMDVAANGNGNEWCQSGRCYYIAAAAPTPLSHEDAGEHVCYPDSICLCVWSVMVSVVCMGCVGSMVCVGCMVCIYNVSIYILALSIQFGAMMMQFVVQCFVV